MRGPDLQLQARPSFEGDCSSSSSEHEMTAKLPNRTDKKPMEDLHMTPPDTRIRVLFILGEGSMDALCIQDTGRAYLKEISRRAASV